MDFSNTLLDVHTSPSEEVEERDLYPVALVYETMTSQVELQVLRDMTLLSSEFPVAVVDAKGMMNEDLLEAAGLKLTQDPPVLQIVYRTTEEWPECIPGVERVQRDLYAGKNAIKLDTQPKVGYYLKEQGRDGANLTEMYLNRSHPRGNGVSDALVVLMWG